MYYTKPQWSEIVHIPLRGKTREACLSAFRSEADKILQKEDSISEEVNFFLIFAF